MKNLKNSLAMLLAIILNMCYLSCSNKENVDDGLMELHLIESEGVFASKETQCRLVVSKDSHGRINYELRDRNGVSLIKSDRPFNPGQKWGIYMDSDEVLWVHSSDVGTVFWSRDDAGQYAKNNVSVNDLAIIPVEVKKVMPKSIIREWEKTLKSPGP